MSPVIEYAYGDGEYCPGCILAAIGKKRMPGKTVEASLAICAWRQGISYHEGGRDWAVFPVASRGPLDELHAIAQCGETGVTEGTTGDYVPGCYALCQSCGNRLGGSCPQMDAITEEEGTARSWLSWWPAFARWREDNDDEGSLEEYRAAAWAAYLASEDTAQGAS